jgi:type IV pilus assembly protein PilV
MGTKQQGTTLIEVMVTVLIVSVGLLGMASLQLKSMALNLAAHQRLQAANLVYEIADSIYLNSAQANADEYRLALADTVPLNTTANTIADIDLRHWLNVVDVRLPNGDLIIAASAPIDGMNGATEARQFAITVCWTDKNAGAPGPTALCNTRNSEFSFIASSRNI